MAAGTAANYHLVSIIEACARLGLDRADLIESSGLSERSLTHPYERQSGDALLRLWRSAEEASKDPLLALRVGMNGSSLHRSILTTVIETSPTLEQALAHAMRYQHLTQSIITSALTWDSTGALGYIEASATHHSLADVRPQIERQFAFVIAEAANLSSRSASLEFDKEVQFSFRPQRPVAEYEDLLGCRVKFSQKTNRLVFDSSIVKLKNFCGCSDTQASLIELLNQHDRLINHGEGRKFAPELQKLISEAIGEENLNIELFAPRLNLSVQALQRKLDQEGTSFSKLYEDVRRRDAVKLLSNTQMNIGEAAY